MGIVPRPTSGNSPMTVLALPTNKTTKTRARKVTKAKQHVSAHRARQERIDNQPALITSLEPKRMAMATSGSHFWTPIPSSG